MTPLEIERRESQMLLAGTVIGLLKRYAADPDKGIQVEDVTVHTDDQGNFQPWCSVQMASGAKLLVAISVLE